MENLLHLSSLSLEYDFSSLYSMLRILHCDFSLLIRWDFLFITSSVLTFLYLWVRLAVSLWWKFRLVLLFLSSFFSTCKWDFSYLLWLFYLCLRLPAFTVQWGFLILPTFDFLHRSWSFHVIAFVKWKLILHYPHIGNFSPLCWDFLRIVWDYTASKFSAILHDVIFHFVWHTFLPAIISLSCL